jgi:SAM-dependent methyltransferase
VSDPDRMRAELRESWEGAAAGWGRRAARERDWAMAVSSWMLDHLALQPGQRVLELAAGAGDTGFLAAELVAPGGTLISSDGAEAMLAVARERAATLEIHNVEFQLLELEWIDLEAATVDAIICRWGLMFAVDPGAALRETRRVLRPGGRFAVAVWDEPRHNPWATIPSRALVETGHMKPPEEGAPGMFAIASSNRLNELLADAGYVEVTLDTVELTQRHADVDAYIEQTSELSSIFGRHWQALDGEARAQVREATAALAAPFRDAAGALVLPGRALVAVAD